MRSEKPHCSAFFATLLAASLATPSVAGAQTAVSALNGYVTLTSDYRNRGLSQSSGEPSLQIGVDYQHRSGLFAGLAAATAEYRSNASSGSSSRREIGWYAGYSRRVARWQILGSIGRYVYPGSGYGYDYDYDEASAGIGFADRVFLTASYIDDVLGSGTAGVNGELSFALPLPWHLELGAAVGRLDGEGAGPSWSHWNAGLSKVIGRLGIDVRYYDHDYYRGNFLGSPPEGAWVLSASYGFSTR